VIGLISRLAALLILASQLLLLAVVHDPTGQTAIGFAFLGHPLLAVGIALALVAVFLASREAPRSRTAPGTEALR
jgi:hypothetical protein